MNVRIAVSTVLVVLAFAALATLAYDSSGALVGSAAYGYEYQYKVTICHHTRSSTNPFVTIVVDSHAVPAHRPTGTPLGRARDDVVLP